MYNDYGFECAVRTYEQSPVETFPMEEPRAYCVFCGRPLYEGEEAYKQGNDIICECCCIPTVL